MPPKFRLFAGPNGSGKTSLFDYLKKQGYIHTEIYVNADRIERDLKKRGSFTFNAYRVRVSESDFKAHIQSSGLLSRVQSSNSDFLGQLTVKRGVLKIHLPLGEINSYHASFVATYLATKLFETKQSFCFETVMFHPSKLDFINLAKSKGYKPYLYFVFTDNKDLNVARVKLRALTGLHDVKEEAIRDRYNKSFELLSDAFQLAEEAFVIDSSDDIKVIAEKHQGAITVNFRLEEYPESIHNYLNFLL